MDKKIIKFICKNGGSEYYTNLLNNIEKVNINDEMNDIKDLFMIWMDEFEWSEKDKDFMLQVINTN